MGSVRTGPAEFGLTSSWIQTWCGLRCRMIPEGTSEPGGSSRSPNTSDTDGRSFHLRNNTKTTLWAAGLGWVHQVWTMMVVFWPSNFFVCMCGGPLSGRGAQVWCASQMWLCGGVTYLGYRCLEYRFETSHSVTGVQVYRCGVPLSLSVRQASS